MTLNQKPPLIRIAVLERKSFSVGAVAEYGGTWHVVIRPVDIHAQDQAVTYYDRHIPIDPHAIAEIGSQFVVGFLRRSPV